MTFIILVIVNLKDSYLNAIYNIKALPKWWITDAETALLGNCTRVMVSILESIKQLDL